MDLDDLGSTKVGSDVDVVVTSWNLLKWNSMLIVLIIACIVLKPLFQAVLFLDRVMIHFSWKFGWCFDLNFKKVEISQYFSHAVFALNIFNWSCFASVLEILLKVKPFIYFVMQVCISMDF